MLCDEVRQDHHIIGWEKFEAVGSVKVNIHYAVLQHVAMKREQ